MDIDIIDLINEIGDVVDNLSVSEDLLQEVEGETLDQEIQEAVSYNLTTSVPTYVYFDDAGYPDYDNTLSSFIASGYVTFEDGLLSGDSEYINTLLLCSSSRSEALTLNYVQVIAFVVALIFLVPKFRAFPEKIVRRQKKEIYK